MHYITSLSLSLSISLYLSLSLSLSLYIYIYIMYVCVYIYIYIHIHMPPLAPGRRPRLVAILPDAVDLAFHVFCMHVCVHHAFDADIPRRKTTTSLYVGQTPERRRRSAPTAAASGTRRWARASPSPPAASSAPWSAPFLYNYLLLFMNLCLFVLSMHVFV